MTTIQIGNKAYSIPVNWNDLSGKQSMQIMKVLYSDRTVEECLLLFLKTLMGVSWYRWFRIGIFEKAEFLYLTYFLVNTNTLTRQLLPKYKGLHGPDDDFNNL